MARGITNATTGGGKLFAAIGVTYPAGSTCTCTKGSKTLRAGDTSGRWVFPVPEIGTWTVTCSNGTDTATKTVEITVKGQSVTIELTYIPLGALYWRGTKLQEFTAYAVLPSGNYNGTVTPTITENAETITFMADGSGIRGGTVMAGAHNLTNYTILRAKLDSPLVGTRKYMFVTKISDGSGFGVSSANANFPAFITFDQTEPGEISLDLSGITGEYYVGFGLSFNSTHATAGPPVIITISELELL